MDLVVLLDMGQLRIIIVFEFRFYFQKSIILILIMAAFFEAAVDSEYSKVYVKDLFELKIF